MQGLSVKTSVEIKYGKEYLYDRLERLFFLKNELPGYIKEGSSIMDYFWEPADSTTVSKIIFEVKRLISKYEEDLNVTAISVGFVPLTSNEVTLIIELELTYSGEDTDVLTFYKIRTKDTADD